MRLVCANLLVIFFLPIVDYVRFVILIQGFIILRVVNYEWLNMKRGRLVKSLISKPAIVPFNIKTLYDNDA